MYYSSTDCTVGKRDRVKIDCYTLYEDFGLGHDSAVPVVSFHSVDGAVTKICLADLQLALVTGVRHAMLLAFVNLTTLLVPLDVGLGFAGFNVTGQGHCRLCRDLHVLQRRHDLRLFATYAAQTQTLKKYGHKMNFDLTT